LPEATLSSTAPKRNPGASGAKVTCTVQLPGTARALLQVVLARVKSRPGVPWVTTFTGVVALRVVLDGM
jgi:hypothetical protein